MPVEELEERRARTASPTTAVTTRKPIATRHDPRDVGDRHRALGDEPDDDGEDHEAEHVVGDRGAEHGARLDGGQRAQIAEARGR